MDNAKNDPLKKFRLIFFSLLFITLFAIVGCRIFDPYSQDDPVKQPLKTLSGAIVIDKNPGSIRNSVASSTLRSVDLSGKVFVAGAEVWLENFPQIPHQITDENGNYEFKNLPPGPYRLVCKFKSEGTWFKVRSDEISADSEGDSIEVPPLEILKAENYVGGILLDEEGNPLPDGTTITVWGEKFYVRANGAFNCGPLPIGTNQAYLRIPDIPGSPHLILPFYPANASPFIIQTVGPPDPYGNNFIPSGFLRATLDGIVTNLV